MRNRQLTPSSGSRAPLAETAFKPHPVSQSLVALGPNGHMLLNPSAADRSSVARCFGILYERSTKSCTRCRDRACSRTIRTNKERRMKQRSGGDADHRDGPASRSPSSQRGPIQAAPRGRQEADRVGPLVIRKCCAPRRRSLGACADVRLQTPHRRRRRWRCLRRFLSGFSNCSAVSRADSPMTETIVETWIRASQPR